MEFPKLKSSPSPHIKRVQLQPSLVTYRPCSAPISIYMKDWSIEYSDFLVFHSAITLYSTVPIKRFFTRSFDAWNGVMPMVEH